MIRSDRILSNRFISYKKILKAKFFSSLALTLGATFVVSGLSATAIAAPVAKGTLSGAAANAEALGAKGFLEELMAKRYGQELSTTLDRELFTIGSQLDVKAIPPTVAAPTPEAPTQLEPISDLMVGTLDPEALMKKYSNVSAPESAKSFLTNFRITKVALSVGLKAGVSPEAKASVEKWLAERVKTEFGNAGTSTVSMIQTAAAAPAKLEAPKTLADWLSQFQSLAGQLLMAFAILAGVVVYQILSKPAGKAGDSSVNVTAAGGTAPTATAGAGASPGSSSAKLQTEEAQAEQLAARLEVDVLTKKLIELLPRVQPEFENILRSWCQLGEAGRLRVACFAEAVGKEIGRLPIPADAVSDVMKMFATMTERPTTEKRDQLQKAYWDLISVINLGAESLNQPFGYLGTMNLGMVNQVLMDQNPKMKTVVSLFMPNDLRTRYMSQLSTETKEQLLEAAASLSEIESTELRNLDQGLKTKLRPNSNQNVVPLEMTLKKLVSSLTRSEELTLLDGKSGLAFDEFKRTVPSIAFLSQWPDDKLSILLGRVSPDEMVAFLRVRTDLKDKFVALLPPMTAEIATDELNRPDQLQEKDKNERLEVLAKRLQEMATLNEINLEDMFPARVPEQQGEIGGLKVVA